MKMEDIEISTTLLKTSEKICLINEKTSIQYTFNQIYHSACRIATLLVNEGLCINDRVIVMLDNSVATAKIYFACLYAGVTVVPINPSSTQEQCDYVLEDSNAKLIITHKRYKDKIVKDNIKKIVIDDESEIEFEQPINPSKYLNGNNVAIIVYTSGTTSNPKGVIHSVNDIVWNGLNFIKTMGISEINRFYNILPMSYLGGYYNLLLIPYMANASVVISSAFNSLSIIHFWDNVKKHEINTLWLVPTIIAIMMEIDRNIDNAKYCRENIILILVGTAPLPSKLKQDFESKYGVNLYENYGLSETLFISTHLINANSKGVGKIVDGVDVDIIDNDGKSLSVGIEGEIIVHTPSIMNAYLGMADKFDKRKDKWFHTGDIGFLDQNNNLHITGRKKDLIIKGGVNISPAAIEDVIYRHQSVRECAAVGIPHHLNGEDIIAVVKVDSDCEFDSVKQEILSLTKKSLAANQQPLDIVKLDELPHTFTGKIQKAKLRAWLVDHEYSSNRKSAIISTKNKRSELEYFKPSQVVKNAVQALSIAYNTMVYELRQKNVDVTVLSLGEAFFDLPLYDFSELPLPESYHYSHSRGIPKLRSVLSEYFKSEYDVEFNPDNEIIITAGSKIAIYMALMALINPGDEVIIPEPAWVSYPEQVKLCHGVPVSVPYYETVYEYEKYITNRTKVLIVNNPNNPRGSVLTLDEVAHLYKLAEKYKLFILSDEAYSDFVDQKEQFISMGNFDKDFRFTIICNSISKNFGISGWRIGYVIANKLLIDQILKLNQHFITCPATILEHYIANHYHDILKYTKPQIKALLEKRRSVVKYMSEIGLTSLPGNTTFYLFLSIENSSLTSEEFCMRLLKEHQICVVPGIGYGRSCDKFVRVSIGSESIERIKAALDKIKEFIENTKLESVVSIDINESINIVHDIKSNTH